MEGLENASLQCPYCWENIEIIVDTSEGTHEYIEDCSVCCCPIVITVVVDEGSLQVTARSEDD